MREMKVPACFGPVFLSMCVVAVLLLPVAVTQTLHAQTQTAPAAGTSVVVRMLDAVNSAKDPAGKQYRAAVTKMVDAGNGVIIRQNSVAAVTLTKSGSGYSAQLASVTINGQPVAVASGSASVTSAAQSAASSAVSSVKSIIGGFGHHANAPSGVTAVAMGQQVVLPPGTTLTFVLSQPPAANAGGAIASSAPSAVPAPAGGGGANPASAPNSPVTSQPAAGGALAANIQETLLGPSKQAAMFVVSPDGGHYAVPTMHGSRELIVIDGVDGPEFDHAAHSWSGQAIDFVFSADGKHSAYVAQSGNDLVEVRDGKTAFTIASVKPGTNLASSSPVSKIDQTHVHSPGYYQVSPGRHQCLISPSGAHVAVVAQVGSPGESAGFYMFLDGVKSPKYNFIDVGQIAFVAEKLIYVAQTSDQKWHLVVNDKPGPAYDVVKNLLVNDDDSHYAFLAAAGGSGTGVGVDGVLGAPRGGIQNVVLASNGRVAYSFGVPGSYGAPHQAAPVAPGGPNGLYVDHHQVAPGGLPFSRTDEDGMRMGLSALVLFSPDGKRFAYVKAVPGGVAPVIDGKVGRTYDAIKTIQFSPDSRHAFYVGNRKSDFLVYDGQEMPGEDANGVSNFVFSQTGDRFAYLARSGQAGLARVVIDGKASAPFKGGLVAHSMSFSQDGKHYAYATTVGYPPSQIIRDGVATSVPSLVNFTTRTGPPHIDFPPLFFSDDGARLVWSWPKSDGVSKDVISIDGQEIMHGYSMYEFPEFSPDSKHFATMIRDANGSSLAVDGKTGAAYEDFLEVNRNVARFLDSHTFRFLGVKNGSVYRVTVNLGGGG